MFKERLQSITTQVGLYSVLTVGYLLEQTGITASFEKRDSWTRKGRLFLTVGVIGVAAAEIGKQHITHSRTDRDEPLSESGYFSNQEK